MTDTNPIERIGSGSVGGKGRALGYLSLLVEEPAIRGTDEARVRVPAAHIITTEEFRRFVEENDLSHCITSHDDALIVDAFLRGRVSHTLYNWLRRFIESTTWPLAVRSSSLNEDAYDHPFAGLYKTVLIPNSSPDPEARLKQLVQAIKLIYASTYLEAPKSYMRAYDLPIEDEAMAVILQEVAGRSYVSRFYPRLAGVARSMNYFPVGGLEAGDGICRLVVGLGFRALEGGEAVSFAPKRPTVRPAHWSPREIAKVAQRAIDVVDLTRGDVDIQDVRSTIKSVPLEHVRKDGVLDDLQSWWNRDDDTLTEGGLRKGEPLLTFNRLLRGELFPFTEQLARVVSRAEGGFQGPVELEFAADFERSGSSIRSELHLLQVRRTGHPKTGDATDLDAVPTEHLVLTSSQALGNGTWEGLRFIVYVEPRRYTPDELSQAAVEVGKINETMVLEKARYLLIGPGRWGSKNRTLGVPVAYNQVSAAGAIVEVSTGDFQVQPSQGTHFFHNITAGDIYYVSLDTRAGLNPSTNGPAGDWLDVAWLDGHGDARGRPKPIVKLIELRQPLTLQVDGRVQRGQVFRMMKDEG